MSFCKLLQRKILINQTGDFCNLSGDIKDEVVLHPQRMRFLIIYLVTMRRLDGSLFVFFSLTQSDFKLYLTSVPQNEGLKFSKIVRYFQYLRATLIWKLQSHHR